MPDPTEQLHSQIKDSLHEFIRSEGPARQVASKNFSSLLKKAKEQVEGDVTEVGDCPDDEVDCSEIVSPCCGATLSNIFGTLPLQVECRYCNKKHYMGEIVRNSIKIKKSRQQV